MSMIISVSYETEKELKDVLTLLDPIIKQWNKANAKKGKFERVYIKTQDMYSISKAKHYRCCIDKLLNELPEADTKFLSQVHTIVKKHKEKVEGLANVE